MILQHPWKACHRKHSSLFGPFFSYDENEVLWIWSQIITQERKLFYLKWSIIETRLSRDAGKAAKLGEAAPNPVVYDVRTSKKHRLLDPDLLDLSRPIVLNFGSCTWPPFMANLVKVKKVSAPPHTILSYNHNLICPRQARPGLAWSGLFQTSISYLP